MASETTEGSALTVTLPSELDDWLDARAEELGVDRETVLTQLLAAYRVASDVEEEAAVEDLSSRLAEREGTVADAVEQALEADELDLEPYIDIDERIERRLTSVEEDTEELQSTVSDQLEEVRRRLVQVKQEADEKAPADHTHEELEQFPEIIEEFETLRSTVSELQSILEEGALIERLDELDNETDRMHARLNTVARAVVGLRSRVSVAATARQETLTDIRQHAAAEGIESAKCDNCENRVTVSLLADPTCPHCGADFASIEPSSRLLFGTATLRTNRSEQESDTE